MTLYVDNLEPGERVATAPHTDAWMMGDRYGVITKIGPKWIHVRMERSGVTRKFAVAQPYNLLSSVYDLERVRT